MILRELRQTTDNMNTPLLDNINIESKRVLVRADLDVGELVETGEKRLETLVPTLKYLSEKKAKTILIGHRGRPSGKPDEKYSLKVVSGKLSKLLGQEVVFTDKITEEDVKNEVEKLKEGKLLMLENLRFDPREENNDVEFSKLLAKLADVYVNEAFSVSHREHASIVGVPRFIPGALGLHFAKEVDGLNRVLVNPEKPVIVLISGLKKDKIDYIEPFKKFADKILVGGRLPEYFQSSENDVPVNMQKGNVIVAKLIPDKEDITLHSIEKFEEEIRKARTIVLSGPLGKYEDEGHLQGTRRVFEAIVNNKEAFKVAGGGDTGGALSIFGIEDKFDWVSVGGGAMLEFLAHGTLPGIDALLN